jgi:mRNA-degrading endonuclease RelE of RelBE toxin-antitoxin system
VIKHVQALPSFLKSASRLDRGQKIRLNKSLKMLGRFLSDGTAPSGFRFKKISGSVYQFRIDVKTRVLVKIKGDGCFLVFMGNHDEISRLLKKESGKKI